MVLTDEYSFNPDTQKINECITRIMISHQWFVHLRPKH